MTATRQQADLRRGYPLFDWSAMSAINNGESAWYFILIIHNLQIFSLNLLKYIR